MRGWATVFYSHKEAQDARKPMLRFFNFTTRFAREHRGTEDFKNSVPPCLCGEKKGDEKYGCFYRSLRIVFLSMVLLVGSVYGAWPTYHGEPDLRGVSEMKLSGQLELAWRYHAGGEIYGTPVSDGERIFVSAKKGRVLAISLKGELLWEQQFTRKNDAGKEMPLRFEAPLVCADGMVFAGSTRGSLIALDAANGEEQWRYETEGIIIGSPNFIFDREDAKTQRVLGSHGQDSRGVLASSRSKYPVAVVVLDQGEGALHCIDVKDGKRIWKTEGVERCDGAPGVGDEVIAFGSCLAKLHIYDHTGAHLKDIEVGGEAQIAGGVALDGNRAYAGVRDGGMLCFDLDKGDVVWSSDESDDQTFSTPAVTETMVIYSSDNGWVYGVDKQDGSTLWHHDTNGGQPTSPVVASEQVIFSADGVLYVLNLKTGQLAWSKEISDEITTPALVQDLVIVGADDGTVSSWHVLCPGAVLGSNGDE
jgi:outer membrane protein assembly factor BamB